VQRLTTSDRKTCLQCKVEKPTDEFYKNKSGLNGLHSKCKPCLNDCRYAKKYGLSLEEYQTMKELPCVICGNPGEVIDHCHVSGKVRNRLCQPCNMALGGFKDNPDLCRKAADYLEQHATIND